VSRDPSLVRLGWKANVQQHPGSPTATVRISGCHCYSVRYSLPITLLRTHSCEVGALFDLTHGSLLRCDEKTAGVRMTNPETSARILRHSGLRRTGLWWHLDLDDGVLDGVNHQVANGMQLSLRMILLRLGSTVLVLKFRTTATPFELLPSARSCLTSRSRAVSVGKSGGSFRDMACPFSRKPASTKSFTRGVNNIRLLCKASTAAGRSRAASDLSVRVCPSRKAVPREDAMKLRILLADDHEIVRRGLCSLLQKRKGWEVCGEASDGREAVDMVAAARP
jgi:hypothetical protein